MLKIALLILCCFITFCLVGQEEKLPKKQKVVPNSTTKKIVQKTQSDFIEIDGLILDETRSKIARDFYDIFYKKWIPPKGAANFSILIKELPSRGLGARVSVLVNENEIFQQNLSPRYDAIESLVNYTIRQARHHLRKQEELNKQLINEDQQGSGIF